MRLFVSLNFSQNCSDLLAWLSLEHMYEMVGTDGTIVISVVATLSVFMGFLPTVLSQAYYSNAMGTQSHRGPWLRIVSVNLILQR